MAKQIHYLMVATHLTGDSELHFFKTREEAQAEFQKRTQPLLVIEGLEEDEDYYTTDNGVRFYSGTNEELSAELGDVDHYFEVNTVEVDDDVECYVADFSEWVDESVIKFYNKQDAITRYNDMVEQGLELINSEDFNHNVIRGNQDTWESEDSGTLFMESDNDDGSTDAFFGAREVYFTYRLGKIDLTK